MMLDDDGYDEDEDKDDDDNYDWLLFMTVSRVSKGFHGRIHLCMQTGVNVVVVVVMTIMMI